MKAHMRLIAVGAILAIGLTHTNATALTLEPAFRLLQIEGECHVRPPDARSFQPAEDGRAYPYGTRIRTGAGSTAVLEMATGNTCRILADASLVLTEVAGNRSHKRLLLDAGEIEVNLSDGFHAGGNKLDVETVSSIATPRGTRFRVAVQVQEDLYVVIIRCLDGSLQVVGRVFGFEVDDLGKDDWVSLIAPMDHSFLRLKNLKGAFGVRIPEGDGDFRIVETDEGVTLKIWQQDIPDSDMIAVSVAITDREGRLVETVVATIPRPEIEDYEGGTDEPVPPRPERTRRAPRERREPGDRTDFSDVGTQPAPTMTTTTLPSPTPVGRR